MNGPRVRFADIERAKKEGLSPTAAARKLSVSRAAVVRAEARTAETLPRTARDGVIFGNDHRAVAMSMPAPEAIAYLLEVIAGLGPTTALDWTFPGAHLTRSERQVLRALVEAAPRIATKDALLDALMAGREGDDAPELKIIDVRICVMRKKLRPSGILIHTHWGIGYTLTAPEGFVWPWVAA